MVINKDVSKPSYGIIISFFSIKQEVFNNEVCIGNFLVTGCNEKPSLSIILGRFQLKRYAAALLLLGERTHIEVSSFCV